MPVVLQNQKDHVIKVKNKEDEMGKRNARKLSKWKLMLYDIIQITICFNQMPKT